MQGKNYNQALKEIPLSNNTVKRRTGSMSHNIKEHLLTRIKRRPKFAIQMDESTDVAGLPQQLMFVRAGAARSEK
jgi:hypothetical protein